MRKSTVSQEDLIWQARVQREKKQTTLRLFLFGVFTFVATTAALLIYSWVLLNS